MKKSHLLLYLAATICWSSLLGCESTDGRTYSTVTGEESSPEEIQTVAILKAEDLQLDRMDLIAQIERINVREQSLETRTGVEIQAGLDERVKFNEMIDGGIDFVGTLASLVFPQAAGTVDLVAPLIRQGLSLFGVGGVTALFARKRYLRKGGEYVAEGVFKASRASPDFKGDIQNGAAGLALKEHFRSAPKPVQDAVNRHKIV